jgi:hypothetical protein
MKSGQLSVESRQLSVISCQLRLVAAALLCACSGFAQGVDASTLDDKVLLGYQGWFDCPSGSAPQNHWSHWFGRDITPNTISVEMYPDLSEFKKAELCAIPGFTIAGKQAYLYSAWSANVVDAHFRWMKENGLDGVLVQRFLSDIPQRRATGDVVLKNVMAAAKAHGRVFAVEYDVSGATDEKFFDVMRDDWQYLVNDLKITEQPGYLRHKGKPVLSVWGMGFLDRHPPEDPAAAKRVIEWFKSGAPENCRVTYMGGVPARWRGLGGDSRQAVGWSEVYAMMDVIQPWTVGRYGNEEAADRWKTERVEPDLKATKEHGQVYMPVVFPGFSWANMRKNAKKNQIPRDGGRFLWRQAMNARAAGATTLKIAMFDEVNEGTAVMKVASNRTEAPEQGFWQTLDADGENLPSDWYLRLAGEITRVFHGEATAAAEMPKPPRP